MTFKVNKYVNSISKWGCPNQNALKTSMQYFHMTTIAFGVFANVVLLYKLNVLQSRFFFIKIYDILKNDVSTCFCWASVENWLHWCNASRSSLLYSGFRYTIELPLQPYQIQLYTFRVQGFPHFLSWFPK